MAVADLRQKVLKWLDPANDADTEYQTLLKAIVPGTCDWFHKRLAKVQAQFIWVLGPPGCGKSSKISPV